MDTCTPVIGQSEPPGTPSAGRPGGGSWKPCREPLRATLLRTVAIAWVIGAIIALRTGGLAHWPAAALLVLWISFGGHWVEVAFLNLLRPRIPASRAVQICVRLAVWFAGGVLLVVGMRFTVTVLPGFRSARWPAWWIGGLAFIGVELIVHFILWLRHRPSFYDGRG